MPNHKSAIKRVRQAPKRAERNKAARSVFRTALKKVNKALAEGNREAAEAQLAATLKVIGKTAKKGLIHPNKAARHASRLQKKVNAMASAPAESTPAES